MTTAAATNALFLHLLLGAAATTAHDVRLHTERAAKAALKVKALEATPANLSDARGGADIAMELIREDMAVDEVVAEMLTQLQD